VVITVCARPTLKDSPMAKRSRTAVLELHPFPYECTRWTQGLQYSGQAEKQGLPRMFSVGKNWSVEMIALSVGGLVVIRSGGPQAPAHRNARGKDHGGGRRYGRWLARSRGVDRPCRSPWARYPQSGRSGSTRSACCCVELLGEAGDMEAGDMLGERVPADGNERAPCASGS
jgi:hypothetical protein